MRVVGRLGGGSVALTTRGAHLLIGFGGFHLTVEYEGMIEEGYAWPYLNSPTGGLA